MHRHRPREKADSEDPKLLVGKPRYQEGTHKTRTTECG